MNDIDNMEPAQRPHLGKPGNTVTSLWNVNGWRIRVQSNVTDGDGYVCSAVFTGEKWEPIAPPHATPHDITSADGLDAAHHAEVRVVVRFLGKR